MKTYPASRNLTRYAAKNGFNGWRMCISRKGYMFTKYFPDAAYQGDEEKSKEAALAMRDEIIKRAENDRPEDVVQEYIDMYAPRRQREKSYAVRNHIKARA